VRQPNRAPSGTVRVLDQRDEAVFWRSHPLAASGVMFWVSQYVELVYGKITLGGHRTDTVGGLLQYASAFANREETQFLPRFISEHDERKLQAIRPDLEEAKLTERREELRRLLRAAVHGPSAPDDPDFGVQSDAFLQSVLARTKGIEWMMSLDRNIGWRVYGVVNDCEGFIAVVTSVLLHGSQRKLLGQCGKCARFFIVERAEGKPRTLYCRKECMTAANADGGAVRQRDRYKRNCAAALLIEGGYGPVVSRDAVKQAFKNHPTSTADQLVGYAKAFVVEKARKKK